MNIPELCYLEGTADGIYSKLDPENSLPRCELMSLLVGAYFCKLLEHFCDCAEVVKREYNRTIELCIDGGTDGG